MATCKVCEDETSLYGSSHASELRRSYVGTDGDRGGPVSTEGGFNEGLEGEGESLMQLDLDEEAVLYGPSDEDLGNTSAADYSYIDGQSADVSSHAPLTADQTELGVQTGQGAVGGVVTDHSNTASMIGYGRRVEPRHAHFQNAALREYTRRAKPLIESVKTFMRQV